MSSSYLLEMGGTVHLTKAQIKLIILSQLALLGHHSHKSYTGTGQ